MPTNPHTKSSQSAATAAKRRYRMRPVFDQSMFLCRRPRTGGPTVTEIATKVCVTDPTGVTTIADAGLGSITPRAWKWESKRYGRGFAAIAHTPAEAREMALTLANSESRIAA